MCIILNFIVLFAFIASSTQINLVNDNDLQGIVFLPLKNVYAQYGIEWLAYKLDMSIMNEILNKVEIYNEQCHDEIKLDKLIEPSLHNMYSNWTSRTDLLSKNPKTIEIFREEIESLKSLVNLPNGCFDILRITSDMYRMKGSIDNLMTDGNTNIVQFIDWEQIKFDTEQILANFSNLYLSPFQFNQYFAIDFLKYTKKFYTYNDQNLYIIFQVPIYEDKSVKLYEIYPKPIIYKNDAYIYKTKNSLVIIDSLEMIPYTTQEYKRNCYTSIGTTFCKKPKDHMNECDKKFLTLEKNSFNRICFEKLPNRNMITQINKQIFFTIFKPMDIYITYNTLLYTVRVSQSSKLFETINYNISTSFFYYTPDGLNSNKYEIFTDMSDNPENILFTFQFASENLILVYIISIILIILIILTMTCCIKHFHK